MTKHSEASLVHVPYNWEYTNAAARTAATGMVPADVGKFARQLDNNSIWMLTDDSPATWSSVGGGSSGSLANSNISPTTANVSATVNTRYFADVSGLTANRNFVVPAGAVGDIIELNIKVGDNTYALVVIGDTGISINGGSTATEWSRLFITGESIHLVADTTSNWQVVYDGRIPCIGRLELSAADTTNTASTETTPTWDTKVIDRGELGDTTNFRFNVRRAGYYRVSGGYAANTAVTDQNTFLLRIYQGATMICNTGGKGSGTSQVLPASISPKTVLCAVADTLSLVYLTAESNRGILNNAASFFQVEEM